MQRQGPSDTNLNAEQQYVVLHSDGHHQSAGVAAVSASASDAACAATDVLTGVGSRLSPSPKRAPVYVHRPQTPSKGPVRDVSSTPDLSSDGGAPKKSSSSTSTPVHRNHEQSIKMQKNDENALLKDNLPAVKGTLSANLGDVVQFSVNEHANVNGKDGNGMEVISPSMRVHHAKVDNSGTTPGDCAVDPIINSTASKEKEVEEICVQIQKNLGKLRRNTTTTIGGGILGTIDDNNMYEVRGVRERIVADSAGQLTTVFKTGGEKVPDVEPAAAEGDRAKWTAKHADSTPSMVNLLQWKDMPKHLQFNPYIHTGYRPLLSVWGSLQSLFYMHNETINILTHGLPIVYILVTVPAIMPWEPESWFLSWCHLIGSVAPWIGSFFYHLFMNLDWGQGFYYRLLQLDMLGIWISQSFGALPMVMATVYCLPRFFRWLITLSYSLLSLWGLYKAMTAVSPWERRLSFMLPFTMRVLLGFLRASSLGGGHPAALTHIVLQDLVSIIGGAIGALHIPEKWFPGTVDMYLNSHNIMHVLVVTAVYSMHQATVLDLIWMSRVQCRLPASSVMPLSTAPAHVEL